MKVFVPSQLYSYTAGQREVDVRGSTVDSVLHELDRRYPGLRFRIINEQEHVRDHIRIFINGEQTFELGMQLKAMDEMRIVGALSGG